MEGSSENELPTLHYDVRLKCKVCGHQWDDKATMDATEKPLGLGYDWNTVHFCPECGKVDNTIDGYASNAM